MKSQYHETIKETLEKKLRALELHFEADVVFYYGEISSWVIKFFRDFIEDIKSHDGNDYKKLVVILNTQGGSVETVEKMVDIMRYHYDEVYFVVPDYAMSAGTILCMSGDRIYMDYSSSLGPIDPQLNKGDGKWVPALGYLDKVEEMVRKSKKGNLSEVEFMLLQRLDLAELRKYEMARDLSIVLLKDWLVKYKFKNWDVHSSNGKKVTEVQKKNRAAETAKLLSNNKIWHSHGRFIGIDTVVNTLKIQVENYSQEIELRSKIREYNDLICEFIREKQISFFIHSRIHF